MARMVLQIYLPCIDGLRPFNLCKMSSDLLAAIVAAILICLISAYLIVNVDGGPEGKR